MGDHAGEGAALWNISLVLGALGDRKEAIKNAELALSILEEIEDPTAAQVRRQLDIWRNG